MHVPDLPPGQFSGLKFYAAFQTPGGAKHTLRSAWARENLLDSSASGAQVEPEITEQKTLDTAVFNSSNACIDASLPVRTHRYVLLPEHAAFLTRVVSGDNLAVFAQYIAMLGGVNEIPPQLILD